MQLFVQTWKKSRGQRNHSINYW